ncbi:MAG: histone deacetylase family protein [Thermoplasmata archaeon]
MKKKPIFYHEGYGNYSFGSFHPFDPERFPKFVEMVRNSEELSSAIEIKEADWAKDKELQLVHSKKYIEKISELEETGGRVSPDTPVKPGTPAACRRIVGGSLGAAKDLKNNDLTLNMGGLHHAGRDYGEGFCLFNDVAIAAEYLRRKGKKVCILDTDAHQGNGTMDIFYTSPDVLFISLHQDPRTLYPGRGYVHEIGDGDGEGYSVNIPLPRDSNIAEYRYAFDEVVSPVVEQFEPDVLIRNGGSDPHHQDSLTDLALDMNGFVYLGAVTSEICKNVGAKHIDLFLSGYGLMVLNGWLAMLKGTMDLDIPTPDDQRIGSLKNEPRKSMVETLDDLKNILEDHWDL